MSDDYRIRIDVGDARGVVDRLGGSLGGEAGELARELEDRRLAVSHDGDEVFVYADSAPAAARAAELVDAVLREENIVATRGPVEHWLEAEERWDDEPPDESWEEDEVERGFAPWEVRVRCASHREARELADRLEGEGYGVERRWHFLIVGAASRDDAEALASRLHGEVEPGGELVWETVRGNPFAVFGGMGGAGTPLG